VASPARVPMTKGATLILGPAAVDSKGVVDVLGSEVDAVEAAEVVCWVPGLIRVREAEGALVPVEEGTGADESSSSVN